MQKTVVNFCKGTIVLPCNLLFAINVGRFDTGEKYFGTDETPGCHWVICHVNTAEKKVTYGDSLTWQYPPSLLEKLTQYINAILKDGDIGNYSIITCHDPGSFLSGVHQCGKNCSSFYPLQTCYSICDVVAMVMSAIACRKTGYFQTCQVLKNVMRDGNFLRLMSTRCALGEILKFEFPRSLENCLSEVFLLPFSKHKPYVFML
jgi:hypothetical protein